MPKCDRCQCERWEPATLGEALATFTREQMEGTPTPLLHLNGEALEQVLALPQFPAGKKGMVPNMVFGMKVCHV